MSRGEHMLPVDSVLPQLQTVLDASAMRARFETLVAPDEMCRGASIREFVLDRFRYRRSERAIVLYRLVLQDAQSGRSTDHWASLSIFAGGKARKAYKTALQPSSCHRTCDDGRTMPLVGFLDEIDGLVQWFPHDRHLPQIASVVAGRDPAITEMLYALPVSSSGRLVYSPVRYRPGVGATILASAIDAEDEHGEATALSYIKIYRHLDPAAAIGRLDVLHEAARVSGGAFDVVEPLGHAPGPGALLLHPAPGTSAEDLLLGNQPVDEIARRCARALASFHLSKVQLQEIRTSNQMLARAHRAADFLKLGDAWLSPQLDEIIRQIESSLADAPLCPAHLDMKADHMFIDDDGVRFIDMESCAMGDPVFDPAMLVARMQAMPEITGISRARADRFVDMFLGAYFDAVPKSWAARFDTAYKCASLKVALYYLQHLEDRWRDKVATLLQRALHSQTY